MSLTRASKRLSFFLRHCTQPRYVDLQGGWAEGSVMLQLLGLTPADEDSWHRLDEMYVTLESVVPLGYALTPHITMAYFRPDTYSQEQVRQISAALRNVDLDIMLRMEDLVLQGFSDMNHYMTIL